MKIAVSATGATMDSMIDPRFGRASYFIVIDTSTGMPTDVIDNRASQDASHGAGISTAATIAEAGVDAVITGRVGPKAFAVLQAAGIKVVSEIEGRVSDAVQAFESGDFTHSDGPDCDAHSTTSPPRRPAGHRQKQGSGGRCGCPRSRRA